MTTHLTWMKESHATVVLHPGGNAQALLTWRANTATGPAPFNPDFVHVTPPDERAHLRAAWPGGPVLGAEIAAWPLRAAPPGPFPAGTGTISGPFNGICMTLASDGTTVVARPCGPGVSSQMWTGYSDGTLRIHGRCLDVTGPGVGAKAKVVACTGAASQKWEIGQVSANDFGPITNAGTGTVLSYPRGSIADGTPLVMGLDRGMDDYFKIVAAGPAFFVSAWLLMIFAGIAGADVGIRPFGYLTAMVVTIGLWLTVAPAIGAIARTGKSGKKS